MIVDGWLDWAIKRPGPPQKVYAQACAREGLVLHSMEGWLAGSFGELDKPERQASWTFSLALDGSLYQHYSLAASTWASGNFVANTTYNALELEGLHTLPINAAQIERLSQLCAELGFGREQLHEHRQVWNMATPNAGPTACPSERYAPLWAALEENPMTPLELTRLTRLENLVGGFGIAKDPANPDILITGNAALEYAHERQWSAFLGIGQVRQAIADHTASTLTASPEDHDYVRELASELATLSGSMKDLADALLAERERMREAFGHLAEGAVLASTAADEVHP